MINIKEAIQQVKEKENISDGGSKCYDFGEVVLVAYSCPTKYLKEGKHSREEEDIVFDGANELADLGVNTPKHIAFERVIDGEKDICYVLQKKCKGTNCAALFKDKKTFEEIIECLKYINDIPFEHIVKMVSDSSHLYRMGYEKKNKNLFYDEETGFWFIDFLNNDISKEIKPNDILSVIKVLNYVVPNPLQLSPTLPYNYEFIGNQKEIYDNLTFSIKAKALLAQRQAFPILEKYEKFYLSKEADEFKQYLMDNNIVKKNLLKYEEEDDLIYNEFKERIVNDLVNSIVYGNNSYWNIETNDIRNQAQLYGLEIMWKIKKPYNLKLEDYEDKYEYESFERKLFIDEFLQSIYDKLIYLESNDNTENYINSFREKHETIANN